MPLYEFKCPTDGVFEKIRPFSESALDAICPTCKIACPRKISTPAPAIISGGTRAQKGTSGVRIGDFPDYGNSWIDS